MQALSLTAIVQLTARWDKRQNNETNSKTREFSTTLVVT